MTTKDLLYGTRNSFSARESPSRGKNLSKKWIVLYV